MKEAIITSTPPIGVNLPQANLSKTMFDALVWQKGYDVIKEAALRCPCQSKNSGQQSSCRNCGGSAWIFVNPTKTRVVLHSMNVSTKFKEWGEENVGTASITCLQEEELSFMDRITVIDSNAIFGQVLFLKTHLGNDESVSQSESDSSSSSESESSEITVYYFNTIYDIKEILYIALFQSTQSKLTPLVYGVDYTYKDSKIKFLTASTYIDPFTTEQDISITIRYKHAVQLHVIDIPRETIQTFNKIAGGVESGPIDLPIHAIGRRSHYVLDAPNYDNTRILDNSHIFDHDELNPPTNVC